eukprot:6207677-Pleurochrysis_carterae.AAC.2
MPLRTRRHVTPVPRNGREVLKIHYKLPLELCQIVRRRLGAKAQACAHRQLAARTLELKHTVTVAWRTRRLAATLQPSPNAMRTVLLALVFASATGARSL